MYASLASAHRLSSVPSDVREYLEFLHRKNVNRNSALRRQAIELLAALRAEGIPAMALKGALSLFLDHYPDRGARLFKDIDVLVPAYAMPRAISALETLGYHAETRYWPIQHAYAEFMRANDPGAVDLHVEMIDAHYILPASDIWQRAQTMTEDGTVFFVPSPTDRILHNLLHAQIHYLGNFYRGELELRQVYDFALLSRRYASEIDWPFIESRMGQHRLATPLQSYTLSASTLFGLPWPLSTPPSRAARLHHRRCLAQLRFPTLGRLAIPWANIRGAFAWHRMNALHGDRSHFLVVRQIHHAIAFFGKSTAKGIWARLFRAG